MIDDNIWKFILSILVVLYCWAFIYAGGEFYKKHGLFGLLTCVVITLVWFFKQ